MCPVIFHGWMTCVPVDGDVFDDGDVELTEHPHDHATSDLGDGERYS